MITQNAIGYLGEYYNLIADIKDEDDNCKTLTFFIKSLPIKNQTERKRVESYGVFEKEGALYKIFEKFPKCKNEKDKWRPNCYYIRSDIIVLEHLINSSYFHANELTFKHMKAVLNNLAKLHAFSISYEIENSTIIGDQFEDLLYEPTISKDIEWFQVGLEAVQTVLLLHPKYQTNEHQKFIKNKFYEKIDPIYDMAKRSNEFRNVLCHRDSWGNNIYFKELNDNKDNNLISSVLIDFQTCCYCPPAVDLLFLIYLNTRRSFRENIFNDCIEWYHNEFNNQLNILNIKSEIITFDEFYKSVNKLKLLSVVYNCIAGTIIHLPNNYLKNLKKTNPEEYEYYMNVNRTCVIKKILTEDKHFNEFMYESVEELMELIYN